MLWWFEDYWRRDQPGGGWRRIATGGPVRAFSSSELQPEFYGENGWLEFCRGWSSGDGVPPSVPELARMWIWTPTGGWRVHFSEWL